VIQAKLSFPSFEAVVVIPVACHQRGGFSSNGKISSSLNITGVLLLFSLLLLFFLMFPIGVDGF